MFGRGSYLRKRSSSYPRFFSLHILSPSFALAFGLASSIRLCTCPVFLCDDFWGVRPWVPHYVSFDIVFFRWDFLRVSTVLQILWDSENWMWKVMGNEESSRKARKEVIQLIAVYKQPQADTHSVAVKSVIARCFRFLLIGSEQKFRFRSNVSSRTTLPQWIKLSRRPRDRAGPAWHHVIL